VTLITEYVREPSTKQLFKIYAQRLYICGAPLSNVELQFEFNFNLFISSLDETQITEYISYNLATNACIRTNIIHHNKYIHNNIILSDQST